MSLGVYIAVFAVMVAASTVQASVGMGQGLLSAPLLRLLHPDLLPGPIVLVGLLTGIAVMVRDSQRTDVAEVVPAIAGRAVGTGIAIALLAVLSESGLTVMIGAIVLILVILRVTGARVAKTPKTLAGAGVASGIGGTIAALGGAPIGLLYEQHARARDFRGPLAVFITAGGIFGVGSLALAGKYDDGGWLLGLALVPPVAIGWILARWVTPIVDRGFLGPIVLVLSSSSAIVLILSQLF